MLMGIMYLQVGRCPCANIVNTLGSPFMMA